MKKFGLFINDRPLVFFMAAFCAGVALGRDLRPGILVLLPVALGAGLAVLLPGTVCRRALTLLLGLCAGLARTGLFCETIPIAAPEGRVMGRICELPVYSGRSWMLYLDQLATAQERIPGKARVYVYDPDKTLAPDAGDTLRVPALTLPSPARNPGGPDQRAMLLAAGVGTSASAGAQEVALGPGLGTEGMGLRGATLALRRAMIASIDGIFPRPEQTGLMRGILLGDKTGLDEDLYEAFRVTGVAHVLAVSGLHVGFFVFLIALVLRRRALARFFVTAAFLLLYAALTGFSASIVRAGLMALVLLAASLFERRYDMLTALAASALIILFVNPFQLFALGFQLSFCAVLGIALLQKPLAGLFKQAPRPVRGAVGVSLAAQAGVSGILASAFHTLSVTGFIANPLVVPLVSVPVVCGLAAATLNLVSGTAALPLAVIARAFLDAIARLVTLFARLGVVSGVPSLSPVLLMLFFLLLAVVSPYVLAPKRIKFRLCAAVFAGMLLFAGGSRLLGGGVKVTFLDVGQGDAIHIAVHGKHYLVDGGDARLGYDYGERVVLPYLYGQGITALDGVFVTHPDSDHGGGLPHILREMPVRAVYLGPAEPSALYAELNEICAGKGIPVLALTEGRRVELGGAALLTLRARRGGEASVGMLLEAKYPVLLAGDMDFEGEAEILPMRPVYALKAGHHGSAGSTSSALLRFIRPRAAIVSVGRNSYGHPAPEALARLEASGARVYRTDRQGAILLDADTGEIRTMLKREE